MESVEIKFNDLLDPNFRSCLAELGTIVVDVGRRTLTDHLESTLSSVPMMTSNATIVEATTCISIGNHIYVINARGDAIRHPDDKPNPDIGYALAYARALRSAAVRIEKIAHGQVEHLASIAKMEHKPFIDWQTEQEDQVLAELVQSTKKPRGILKKARKKKVKVDN